MKWPYLTDPQIKIRGKFKQTPEDFLVEEVPLYTPCGSGEHLYVFIEKRNLTTDQVIRKFSQHLGIPARNIGFAGKKDRVGVTRQWFSLWKMAKERLQDFKTEGVEIIEAEYHRNKLRPGHLSGNRFRIVLQGTDPDAEKQVLVLLETLRSRGVPNHYGPQRFGNRGDNARIGAAVLEENWQRVFDLVLGSSWPDEHPGIQEARKLYEQGEYAAALQAWPNSEHFPRTALRLLVEADGDFDRAGRHLPRNMLKFFINSLQSFWFNASLSHRLKEIDRIWVGDLAYLHRNGAVFLVSDAEAEQPRVREFEISPSGPNWGAKMILPRGKELQLELEVLQKYVHDPDALQKRFKRWRIRGERRPYRVPLHEFQTEQRGDILILQFALPPGSYATAVIRELMKENFPEPEIAAPEFTAE